jgi:hypothetical protein
MIFKSALGTDFSGSLGGLTASRNRGGMYLRARVVPINPNTPQQAVVRAFVATLTSGWNDTLTPAQRDSWDSYAEAVQLPNSLGDPRNVSGIAMYIRSNVPRLQAALPRVDTAPFAQNLGTFTAPTFDNALAATDVFDVTFDNSDPWANEDDSAMLILASRPKNATVNFFKGPYRFAGLIAGDAITPPTSPATLTNPFNFEVGQRIFVQARVSRADGRLALPFRGFALGA